MSNAQPILRRVKPQARISALADHFLFAWGGNNPDGFFRFGEDSKYRCPSCQREVALAESRVLEFSMASPPRPSLLPPESARAFAEAGVPEGYDLRCACGVDVRIDCALSEWPSRSGEFVPAIREVLELLPAK